MDTLLHIVQTINFYLSDYILVFLLVGTGLFFSIRTCFVQVRCFGEGMRRVFGNFSMRGGAQKGGLSSFQALTTAIAAQVGTGNIVGSCGAILVGGPGAIFWMWIIAFFGMATIYAEAVLAQETRVVHEDGSVSGGPVYYIKRAFNNGFGTFLAVFFAIAITLALGFIGCMVQSNSIGQTCSTAFGIPAWVIGIVVAILAAIIFLGGVNRVAAVTEKLVPIMAVLYLVGGLILLILRLPYLPETIGMIFKYAFFPNAIIGGGLGYALKTAISQGVKRGLFSNEAGSGSAPCAAAAASCDDPVKMGFVQALGVLIDTVVICSCTAFMMLLAPANVTTGLTGMDLLQAAAQYHLGSFGVVFIAVTLALFSFSTFIGILFYARSNVAYLFGDRWGWQTAYKVLALVMLMVGGLEAYTVVWDLGDVGIGLMTIFNLIALYPMSGEAIAALRDYECRKHLTQN